MGCRDERGGGQCRCACRGARRGRPGGGAREAQTGVGGRAQGWCPRSSEAQPVLLGLSKSNTVAHMASLWVALRAEPVGSRSVEKSPRRDIDFEKIRTASPVDLLIAATEVATGRPRNFRKAELTVESVLASACSADAASHGRDRWDRLLGRGLFEEPGSCHARARKPLRRYAARAAQSVRQKGRADWGAGDREFHEPAHVQCAPDAGRRSHHGCQGKCAAARAVRPRAAGAWAICAARRAPVPYGRGGPLYGGVCRTTASSDPILGCSLICMVPGARRRCAGSGRTRR